MATAVPNKFPPGFFFATGDRGGGGIANGGDTLFLARGTALDLPLQLDKTQLFGLKKRNGGGIPRGGGGLLNQRGTHPASNPILKTAPRVGNDTSDRCLMEVTHRKIFVHDNAKMRHIKEKCHQKAFDYGQQQPPNLLLAYTPRPGSQLNQAPTRVGRLLAFVRDSPPSRSGPKAPWGGGDWGGGGSGRGDGGGGGSGGSVGGGGSRSGNLG